MAYYDKLYYQEDKIIISSLMGELKFSKSILLIVYHLRNWFNCYKPSDKYV